MEDKFEKNEKLISNIKLEKKKNNITTIGLILIIISCLIFLYALYYLFKSVKLPKKSKDYILGNSN